MSSPVRPHQRRRRTAHGAIAALALVAATQTASPSFGRGGDGPNTAPPDTVLGEDGLYYDHSPTLVEGRNHYFYFGQELDAACGVGRSLSSGLQALAELAKVISKSGRKVVFTVAPNKSAVDQKHLPPASALPQGDCDLQGIKDQDKDLDGFKNRYYLPVRKELADLVDHGKQAYWKVDTHWTTVGAVTFTKDLAERLNPKVAALQRFKKGKQTILTDMAFLGVLPGYYETGPATYSTTPVTVTPAAGSPAFDLAVEISPDLSWNSSPKSRTIGSQTTLVGDSFTYRDLQSLMPLFRHGHFVWVGNTPIEDDVAAIKAAHTVVIEVVQRYISISPLTNPAFRAAVADALGVS